MDNVKMPKVLRFNPGQMSRTYGSNIYITKGNQTNRIQFHTKIIYAGLFMDVYPIFHLYKYNIYLNKTKPDEHAYRLAEACNKTFYPIVVICNKGGQIVSVRNDQIKKRWQKQKPLIEREFIGQFAENYINQTDRNLNNPNQVLNLVDKDLFFSSFFSLRYHCYFDTEIKLDQKMYFFAFNPPLETQGLQKNIVEGESILVRQTGSIIDQEEFKYNKLLNQPEDIGCGTVKGDYTINYKLDFDSQLIDAILYDATLKTKDDAELIQIKMESYYLRELPLTNIEDQDTILLGKTIQEEEKKANKRNKKPLWQRFKDYLNEPYE